MTTPRVASQACFATANQCTVSRARNFDRLGSDKVTAGPCEPATEVHCYQDDRQRISCYSTAAMCDQERSVLAELFPERDHGPCARR